MDYHRRLGILTQAWSPLGRVGAVLEEAVILDTARVHGITPAQVVLAWHGDRGVVAIPNASSAEQQRSNLAAADVVLDAAEVSAISALGRPDGRLFDGDPVRREEL